MQSVLVMRYLLMLFLSSMPIFARASGGTELERLDLTGSLVGIACVLIFVFAYVLVVLEEKTHLRKSKPVLFAAGLIWICIAFAYNGDEANRLVTDAIRHNFLEYAELFFFLLVAMTYINAMLERGVFDALRYWLVNKGYSFRQLFWITGLLAFCLSPVADNLTTALIMCAVVLAVGKGQPQFVGLSCIGIVIGANAGGAFSPFGDITTLMVWQKGIAGFWDFFALFIPALVNYLVPAMLMQLALPVGSPHPNRVSKTEQVKVKYGGYFIVVLFLLTIVMTVILHGVFHLPPVIGMMFGLGYLKLFGFYIRRKSTQNLFSVEMPPGHTDQNGLSAQLAPVEDFDIFDRIAQAEWDTLFFFYGVILAVGGLGFLGYLTLLSEVFYSGLGPTVANVSVGFLSAIVDNIPVMFAVLTMDPDMSHGQWLLVTLTAGVGGSMLSIGSAAGVALMGQARGQYTFFAHLKWTPVIILGYFASVATHSLLNM